MLVLTTSCFSPYRGDGAVITIAMGETPAGYPAAASRAINLESGDIPRLVHTIELVSAEGQRHTKEGVKQGETATMLVTPGVWNITVYAYFETDGEKNLIARGGEENRELTSGPNTVRITMRTSDTLGGTGTPTDPFLVYNETTLRKVGKNENNNGWTLGASYKLISDITLTAVAEGASNWARIGGGTYDSAFTGTFDGGGHIIRNLTIDVTGDYQGMFGYIGSHGTVKNLTLSEVNISGSTNIGGIAGYIYFSYGMVQNCTVSGTVSGDSSVGGVVGNNSGTIDGASFTGETGTGTSTSVGGIAGSNSGYIRNVTASGTVSGDSNVGGIAGDSASGLTIIGASFTGGTVTGISDFVGGIVGNNQGDIQRANVSGTVSGGTSVGGIAGYNMGGIQGANVSGTVSGGTSVGGIAGENGRGGIHNCYASGMVSGDNNVGGIAGYNNSGVIQNCAALNERVTGTVAAGRVTGQNRAIETLINNWAWDGLDNDGNPSTPPGWPVGDPLHGADVEDGDAGYNDSTWWTMSEYNGPAWTFYPADPDSPWIWDANADDGRGNKGLPVLRNVP